MPTTYSTNLALSLIATGEQAGNWGTITNTNLGTLIEQAISGYTTQAITNGADTTIDIQNGVSSVGRNMAIEMTGALTASRNLIVPSNRKLYFIYNNTTGGFAVTVKVSGQTGVSVPNGRKIILVCNGTDVVQAADYTAISYAGSFIPLSSSVPTNGVYLPSSNTVGVAANSTNVLNATSGGIQIGSPTGGYKGAGTINATGLFVDGNAVGVGTGTVTSVTGTGTVQGITLTGTGTTSPTLTLGGSLSAINLTSQVTGALPIGNGGTGQTSAANAINALVPAQTGQGGKYLKTDGSVVSWDSVAAGGGTVTSIEVTTGSTGLLVSGGTSQTITSSGTFAITGNLAAGSGGTGNTSYTIGDILYASGSTTLSKLTGVAIGNALISGGVGTAPSYGKIGLTTHVSGTLAVGSGGTGVGTLTGIVKGNGTSNFSAATAGTDFVAPGGALGTPSSGTLTNCTGLPVATGISGLGSGVATFLATPSSANLAAAVTGETGTGSLVFSASPTFTGTANFAAIQTTGVIDVGNASDTTLSRLSGGKLGVEGVAMLRHNSTYTSGNVFVDTGSPTGGSDGDIWLKYTP